MHQQPYCETLRARLLRDRANIDALLADPDIDSLVLERLPSGEYAWLRPEPRINLTDAGRAAIAS